MKISKKLTIRQKKFCHEYLIDFNGRQAAIRAGYSAKTAEVIAYELLRKPYIKPYIEQKVEEQIGLIKVEQFRTYKRLKEIAFMKSNKLQAVDRQLRAIEILAKYLEMIGDKVSVKIDQQISIREEHDKRSHIAEVIQEHPEIREEIEAREGLNGRANGNGNGKPPIKRG